MVGGGSVHFKVLLVEDADSFREAVSQLLGVYNDVEGVSDLASARLAIEKSRYDVIILDKELPDGDGTSLIPEIKNRSLNTVLIILTSDSDFDSIKRCVDLGAEDYVVKSENTVSDLLIRIPIAISKMASSRKLGSLEQQVQTAFRYEIVGKSSVANELRNVVLSLKGSNSHVMITGESGTGKELIARRLHAVEGDPNRPFVALNCGAVPENLLESELFGHRKGSFTGAYEDRVGCFELAHNGDLFLDELGEMPLSAQVKLLRVIQEGELSRVGDHRLIQVNCRIIAATNQNLEDRIRKGQFRLDLYHRLNVFSIPTHPLRFHKEDIHDLAQVFTFQLGGPQFKMSHKAIQVLMAYDWPGNIRELRNVVERSLIFARKRKSFEIGSQDIVIYSTSQYSSNRLKEAMESYLPVTASDLTPERYQQFYENMERLYFEYALDIVDGSAVDLAACIGIGRSTIFKKLRMLDVGTGAKRFNLPLLAKTSINC